MVQRPKVSVRFDSRAQLSRISKAAKIRKWTINKFVLYTAEQEAEKLLATNSLGGQLATEGNPLALNQ